MGDEAMNFREENLLLTLNKGIDDMENGRELLLDDAERVFLKSIDNYLKLRNELKGR